MSKIQYNHIDFAGSSLIQRRHKRQVIPPGMWAVNNFIPSRSDNMLSLRPDFNDELGRVFGISNGLQIQNFDESKDFLNSVHGIYGSQNLVWFTSYIPWGIYNTTGSEQILSATYTTGRAAAASDSYTVSFNNLGAGYDIRKYWWRGCLLEFNGDGNYYVVQNIVTGDGTAKTGTVSVTMPTQSDYSNTINYQAAAYKWTASGGGTNEYYLELSGGGDPSAIEPIELFLGGTSATKGTVGSLADHEWGFGDGDTLGYDTVYIADATGDPDATAVALTGYQGYTYTLYKTHNSMRATKNKLTIDEFGGAMLYCNPTIENNFSAYDICGPFYTGVTETDWQYNSSVFIDDEPSYLWETDCMDSAYQWTKSSSGSYEYYLEASGGGDPSLLEPSYVLIDGYEVTQGTAGNLGFDGWDYDDNDSLGFNTLYISAYNADGSFSPSEQNMTVVARGAAQVNRANYITTNYALATTGTSWILLTGLDLDGVWKTLDINDDDAWTWLSTDDMTITVPQPNGDDVLATTSSHPLRFRSIRRDSTLGYLASGLVALSSATGGGTTWYPCIMYSSDQGVSWTVKIDTGHDGANNYSYGCAYDGTTLFMISLDSDNYFRYSADLGDTWNNTAGETDSDGSANAPRVKYEGGYFIVISNDGNIYYSTDGQTFSKKAIDDDVDDVVVDDIAYNQGDGGTDYWVFVDDEEQVIGQATSIDGTYSDVTPSWLGDVTWYIPTLNHIFYDKLASRFVTNCGTFLLASVDYGTNWKQNVSGFQNLILRGATPSPSNMDWSGQLIATMVDRNTATGLMQHLVLDRSYTVSWDVDLFEPLSDLYRATTFSVLDGYVVLIGTSEWNNSTKVWDYYPKRVRWTAPGTYKDFTSTGTGSADAAGPGSFLASVVVNGRIVVFETNRVSAIVPRGDTSDPWDFDVIKDDFKFLSNPVAVNEVAYIIGSDGLLWQTDGIDVAEVGASFDLTKFDDFIENKPVWLVYSRGQNSLYVFYRDEDSSTHPVYCISLATGGVTEINLLEVDDTATKAEQPASVVAIDGSTRQNLYVSHHPFNADSDRVVIARLDVGRSITGQDDLGSSQTGYWSASAESGELFITREGEKSSLKHIIVETYTAHSYKTNDDRPYLVAEVKSIEDDDFSTSGDTVGTATMTDTTMTGSSTAWSTTIGRAGTEVDGVETDFTLPCQGSQARVYLDSTLQVEDTDYTVSGNTISFTTAPANTKTLYAYWENYPEVKVKVGDFFKSSEGWHQVTAINTATNITLDHYLSSGSEPVIHYPAWQLDDGDGRVEIGINRLVEGVQIRLYLIPDYDGSQQSTVAKITGLSIGYVPQGRKTVKATGS